MHLDPRGRPSTDDPVVGGHDAGAWGGHHGADLYTATLKSGWVFDSYDCATSTDDPTDSDNWAHVAAPTFPSGESHMQLEVDWSNGACNEIDYQCWVAIAGPLGVPSM